MAEPVCTWEQGPDGTYAVRGVPIFELGEHRGFRYDKPWAGRAIETFRRLRNERGYLPPVILGHTAEDGDEKPAVGFIDRLRLAGRQIVADLVGLGRDVFEQIRAGRWPYRSVEVFDRAAQITALALLGGTPPYLKTAPLHFADDGTAAVWLDGASLPRLLPGHDDGGTMDGTDKAPARRFSQDELDRLVEEARTEERTKMESELNDTKKRLAQLENEAHAARVKQFRAGMREMGYTPAVIESREIGALIDEMAHRTEPVRFADESVPEIGLFGRVLALIASKAAESAAFVEPGEVAPAARFQDGDDGLVRRFGDRVDPDSIRRLTRAHELAKAENIPFREALLRVQTGETA